MMSKNVPSSLTPECNGGVARKMARFLWQFCRNCHKSPFSGGNRLCPIGNLCHFAQIFHGHFCQLVKNQGFLKSWEKKGVFSCKDSPHRPTLRGNCQGKIQRNMYGFFVWQLPTEQRDNVPSCCPSCLIACLCHGSYRMSHPLLLHGPWRKGAWFRTPSLPSASIGRRSC